VGEKYLGGWEKEVEIQNIKKEKQALLKSIQNQKAVYRKVIQELETRARELEILVEIGFFPILAQGVTSESFPH
jgi:hypothetical protein